MASSLKNGESKNSEAQGWTGQLGAYLLEDMQAVEAGRDGHD